MWTVPNILTLARIGAIPLVIAGLMVGGDTFRWVACGVFVAACLTDFFDGYLARVLEQQSEFGRFLDPIADKLLVAALLLVLTASGEISGLSVIAAVIILCREIMVSGLREFLAGHQVTFMSVVWQSGKRRSSWSPWLSLLSDRLGRVY